MNWHDAHDKPKHIVRPEIRNQFLDSSASRPVVKKMQRLADPSNRPEALGNSQDLDNVLDFLRLPDWRKSPHFERCIVRENCRTEMSSPCRYLDGIDSASHDSMNHQFSSLRDPGGREQLPASAFFSSSTRRQVANEL